MILSVGYIYRKTTDRERAHENLHHRKTIIMNTMAASGAYCRIIAETLIFRAALRYFSDSERREVDKWDIPVGGVSIINRSDVKSIVSILTIEGITSP